MLYFRLALISIDCGICSSTTQQQIVVDFNDENERQEDEKKNIFCVIFFWRVVEPSVVDARSLPDSDQRLIDENDARKS